MSLRFTHFSLFVLVGCSAAEVDPPATAPPNVLIILADDLGLGDVRAAHAAGKIETPCLDRLAAEGMTFTDAHSPSSVCTPTRYGLLTGRYPWRSKLERGVLDGSSPPLIPEGRATIAQLARAAGYRSSMIGKWHLGWNWSMDGDSIDFEGPVTGGPDACGFDHWFAHAASLDMPPYVWVRDGAITAVPDRTEGVARADDRYGWYREGPIGADFRIPDVLPRLFEEAQQTIEDAARDEQSFLLYLALPAPHTPIVPLDSFQGASGLNPYADFVMQVDHHVGELLDTLERTGVAEDTLVVFTSDNGCSPEANFPLLAEHGHDPSAGFRGHKADLYEGGHRVPFLVRWPGHVPAGVRSDALVSLTDLYPTIREVLGVDDDDVGGEDGFSLVPVWNGGDATAREDLVMHSISGHFAIRRGPWKLCLAHGSGGWSAPRERAAADEGRPPEQLFHLGDDPGEERNLAAQEPGKVSELRGVLDGVVERGRSNSGVARANDREVDVEAAAR